MAEEGDPDLGHDDDQEGQPEGKRAVGEGDQREGTADAVDDEPPDRAREGVETGGEDVPEEAEGGPTLDHLGDSKLRAPRGQDAVGD